MIYDIKANLKSSDNQEPDTLVMDTSDCDEQVYQTESRVRYDCFLYIEIQSDIEEGR